MPDHSVCPNCGASVPDHELVDVDDSGEYVRCPECSEFSPAYDWSGA